MTVAVRQAEEMVELRVLDAGRGVPAGERERVFERFHRVAGDATRGTGLGLAIVKAIVERHQGSIALADADPGRRCRDSRFRSGFPRGAGTSRPAEPLQAERAGTARSGLS